MKSAISVMLLNTIGHGMNDLYYKTENGEYKPLSSIESVNLTVSDEDLEKFSRIWHSETWECGVQIENPEEFEKKIIFGGDRGRYNGHILKKDGYLSERNGWIDEDTD